MLMDERNELVAEAARQMARIAGEISELQKEFDRLRAKMASLLAPDSPRSAAKPGRPGRPKGIAGRAGGLPDRIVKLLKTKLQGEWTTHELRAALAETGHEVAPNELASTLTRMLVAGLVERVGAKGQGRYKTVMEKIKAVEAA